MGRIQLAAGLTLPHEAVTETFAILANRGAGKSVTAHRMVEQLHRAGLPVVVLDVKGDWWGIRSSADGKGPGLPFVIFGGDHADVPLESTAGELLADLIIDDRIPAVLDMSHMSKTKARAFATVFAERLYIRNRDPLHVVIEEADVLVPQRASADTARLLGAMEDIAKRGRSRGIGLTVVTQRSAETAKSVLEMMETVILMRMTGPRSIKAVQDWIGVNADADGARSREVIASLPSLETGQCWIWSPAFLRLLKRVRIQMFDTFDSHATPKPGQARVVPKSRADIDLVKLGAEITATVERAKDNDPRALRVTVASLQTQLAAAQDRIGGYRHEVSALRQQLAEAEARAGFCPAEVVTSLELALQSLQEALATIAGTKPPFPQQHPTTVAAARPAPSPTPAITHLEPSVPPSDVRFRAGAHRMLEALGRMAPLRLNKAQWGTVAKMKHTSGTFSTYLSELRRAGLVNEDSIGFSLTDAGFGYLGGRPAPMTSQELQQHYLSILRSGAARMLQAIIDTHPAGLDKATLSEQAGIVATSGTFSTYLSELRRNGLIEQRDGEWVASDILMHSAAPG